MKTRLLQLTYYVRHPDDSYSVADPQPFLPDPRPPYALCDQKHTDDDCEDPDCYLLGKEPTP